MKIDMTQISKRTIQPRKSDQAAIESQKILESETRKVRDRSHDFVKSESKDLQ